MTDDQPLEQLDQTNLTLAPGEPDLRGATVVDSEGEDVGRVDALYVDGDERKVRFLQVKRGGILGLGDTTSLVPVEAIDRFDVGTVHLGHAADTVAGGPKYDPALVDDQRYWEDVYGWYGYPPYWAAAGVYPGVMPYPGPYPRPGPGPRAGGTDGAGHGRVRSS